MNKRQVAILICAVALAIGAFSWWMPAPSAAPQKNVQRRDRCASCPPPSERRIYAPAIELREAERCEIVLNSRSANPVEITPTFYTANGHAVVGNAVQLQPAEIRFISVEELIPEALRGRHRWGGIALSYTGNVLEVWAQLTFHGVGGSGSIDETFNILEETGSDTREAVWRMPKSSTATIVLGNSSNSPVHTTAQFSDGDSEEIEIGPFATKFLRRRSHGRDGAGSRNESVKLTTVGPEGSLRVTGFIIDDDRHFSSSIRFHDPKKTVQPNLYATNLRLNNTTPRMVLKNTSDVPVSARPRFLSAAGEQGQPVELPPVTLRPGQIVAVDLSAVREAAASRTDFDSVSVQVLNSGAPGSLIGAAYSTDRESQLTHDVPLRDSGKIRNATGSYPWRVDQDYSTVAVITNIGNQAARFQVEIRYPGGPYSVKQRELAVGETATFDLRQMRDEQKPDRVGKTLPRDLERGQFHWSLVNTPGEPRIIGRAEVVSRAESVSSSYSCPTCCPDSGNGGSFNPNAYTLAVNGFVYTGAQGQYYDCYSNWYTGSLMFSSMWTDNTSVATINASEEQLQGIGAGQTTVAGDYDFTVWDTDGMDCYSSNYTGSDNAPVQTVCAVPTNFRQVGSGTDIGGGNLRFNYAWDSSTGNLSHLSQCTVGEIVTYPSGNPFSWPSPMVNSSTNPLVINGAATAGVGQDIHSPPNSFSTPYTAASFTATQNYRFRCPCHNSNNYVTLMGPINIVRAVSQNSGTPVTWRYTVTKSGASATINPLP